MNKVLFSLFEKGLFMYSTIAKYFLVLNIVLTALLFDGTITAQDNFMDQLSLEEQEQLMQTMIALAIVKEAVVNIAEHYPVTVDWLLEHALQDMQRAAQKIMEVSEQYMKQHARSLVSKLAGNFGIQGQQDTQEFVAGMMDILEQALPSEFEKWIYCSARAKLVRRK